MSMQVFNSLTRRVEPLEPLADNTIRLYTCGPTVYNFAHIGNFRAYTFEDILRRVVQFNGMKVKQVMNLTDVDDKTIRGANAAGVALTDYTKTYKDAFFADLKVLNIQPAEVYPAATDHIPEMIALVEKLVEKGVAYKSDDGSVYFAVTKFPGYGKLAPTTAASTSPSRSSPATASSRTSTSTTSARARAAPPTSTTRRTWATSRSGRRGRNRTAPWAGIRRGDADAPAGTSSAPRCR